MRNTAHTNKFSAMLHNQVLSSGEQYYVKGKKL